MTEWGVVGVLIALAGLIALLVKPMLSLTRSITKLTCSVDTLQRDIGSLTVDNQESHRRIWKELDGHAGTLNEHAGELADHDKRLCLIEHQKGD